MPDYAVLAAYAVANPGKTNAELATMYGSATVTVRQSLIDMATLLKWGGSGPIASISAAQTFTNADAATQTAVRAAAISAMLMFGSITSFDVDDTENQSLLSGFVAAGVLTSAEQTSLLALGNVTVPLYNRPGQFGVIPTDQDFTAAGV